MQHAIFKSAVRVNNQEESDVVEELCKKYSLPIWPSHNTFEYLSEWITRNPLTDIYFYFHGELTDVDNGFLTNKINAMNIEKYNVISLEEFEKLAKDYSGEYDTIDEIIDKLNEINKILNNK